MRVVAVMAALLLAPLSAVAAGTDAHVPVASGSSSAYAHDADSHPREFDCTIPANGEYFLCCHFASPCPQAAGPLRSLDDDQPVLAVNLAAFAVQKVGIRSTSHSASASITVPPRFILFGNFRS